MDFDLATGLMEIGSTLLLLAAPPVVSKIVRKEVKEQLSPINERLDRIEGGKPAPVVKIGGAA